MNIQPFTIAVPQATLDDLQHRLAQTRWPDEAEGVGWAYGTNLGYLKELVDSWQHSYDWRTQEARLNQLAHFHADSDGSRIHFIHVRGKGPHPMPLLLIHGWPDSFFLAPPAWDGKGLSASLEIGGSEAGLSCLLVPLAARNSRSGRACFLIAC